MWFFRLFALSLVVLSVAGGVSQTTRPNIIFILADDLGYGDLACYGQPRINTPRIDQMAAEGMRFTNAYSGFTVCAPSRSVLMTGQHTGHTRVRSNGSGPLQPEDITIAEFLKSAGYRTGLIGKWGLGEEETTGAPWRQGFDRFYGYLNQGHAHNFYPEFVWSDDKKIPLRNKVIQSKKFGGMSGVATVRIDYTPDLMADEAIEFIEANQNDPFFLYLALTIPHANNEAGIKKGEGDPGWKVIPEQLGKHRERQGMEVPDAGEYQARDWPGPQKGTAAMITRMDGYVGRVFEKLKALGIDENTIVFFSSDNGPHAEGGNDPHFFNSMGPLQGYKRSFHDGGIRVPMIVRWPGKIEPGSESATAWYFADVLPTVADLLDMESPEGIDGVSVLPTILGEEQDLSERFLYWGSSGDGPGDVTSGAVRVGKWKAVIKDNEIRLYDLDTDIAEARDLAVENPLVIESVRTFLKESVVPPS